MEPAIFESGPKKSRHRRCAVPGCKSSGEMPNITFHNFPAPEQYVFVSDHFGNETKRNKLQAWKTAVRLEEISSFSLVCSLHFQKNDYKLPDLPATKRKLKPSAVPSLYLPGKCVKRQVLAAARHKRYLKRSSKTTQDTHVKKIKKRKAEDSKVFVENSQSMEETSCIELNVNDVNNSVNTASGNSTENIVNTVETSAEKNTDLECLSNVCKDSRELPTSCNLLLFQAEEINSNDLSELNVNNVNNSVNTVSGGSTENIVNAVQTSAEKNTDLEVNSNDFSDLDSSELNTKIKKPSFLENLKSDSELSTATGIETFKIFETIVSAVRLVVGERFEKKAIIMNTSNRVLLTFVKLKQNLSYSFLAILFNCISRRHCQRIFCETIQLLNKSLSAAILWPTRQEIRKNMPQCFNGFEDVRVVMDCTEIAIERPKNLCCQIITYSFYKGGQTCKFLTGVTPAGNISYVSKPYGGRASDTSIFEQSSILELLEEGDAVMVDRGFFIDEICQKNKWKCIKPPYLKEKKQFSSADSIKTAKIAKARVHIERSNQRLKMFKILGSAMPVNLVPYVEDIMRVICATVNLSSPILSDDKFIRV